MVRIEIIVPKKVTSSIPCRRNPFNLISHNTSLPSENNAIDGKSIAALARTCAASQIQSLWRGILCRKEKYTKHHLLPNHNKVSLHDVISYQKASLMIQKCWKKYYTEPINPLIILHVPTGINMACQTEILHGEGSILFRTKTDLSHYPLNLNAEKTCQMSIDKRKDAIAKVYESCYSKILKEIHLNGFEILNLLQAMSVLMQREYEVLSKALLTSSSRSRGRKNTKGSQNHIFKVRLIGSLQDFENDIYTAWKSLIKIATETSLGSAIFLRKQGNRLKANNSSRVARLHLQKLASLSHTSLAILEENKNIILYDHRTIENFLSSVGIDCLLHEESQFLKKSIVDHLEEKLEQTTNSFLHSRIQIALEVLQRVIDWESHETSPVMNGKYKGTDIEFSCIEKDKIILALEKEVEQLKEKIQTLEVSSMASKACNQLKSSNESRCTAGKHTQQNHAQEKIKLALRKKKRRQNLVNRVDIKFNPMFDEKDEKSKKTLISDERSFPMKHKTLKKRHNNTLKNQSCRSFYAKERPNDNTRISLEETISKAQEKRIGLKKKAWQRDHNIESKQLHNQAEAKLLQHEDRFFWKVPGSDQEVRTNNNEKKKSANLEHEQTPDARFNSILDKLRVTASDFQFH